jgi:hypothetical protein
VIVGTKIFGAVVEQEISGAEQYRDFWSRQENRTEISGAEFGQENRTEISGADFGQGNKAEVSGADFWTRESRDFWSRF